MPRNGRGQRGASQARGPEAGQRRLAGRGDSEALVEVGKEEGGAPRRGLPRVKATEGLRLRCWRVH